MSDCIKVATDFVSIENVSRCWKGARVSRIIGLSTAELTPDINSHGRVPRADQGQGALAIGCSPAQNDAALGLGELECTFPTLSRAAADSVLTDSARLNGSTLPVARMEAAGALAEYTRRARDRKDGNAIAMMTCDIERTTDRRCRAREEPWKLLALVHGRLIRDPVRAHCERLRKKHTFFGTNREGGGRLMTAGNDERRCRCH